MHDATIKIIATVRKDHQKHSDTTPIDSQFGISCLPRIPWGAAYTTASCIQPFEKNVLTLRAASFKDPKM